MSTPWRRITAPIQRRPWLAPALLAAALLLPVPAAAKQIGLLGRWLLIGAAFLISPLLAVGAALYLWRWGPPRERTITIE